MICHEWDLQRAIERWADESATLQFTTVDEQGMYETAEYLTESGIRVFVEYLRFYGVTTTKCRFEEYDDSLT